VSKFNKTEYDQNYDQINWTKKVPKTFKTSWGVEYTVMIEQPPSDEESQNTKKRPSSIT
jgi:hypothetical protein